MERVILLHNIGPPWLFLAVAVLALVADVVIVLGLFFLVRNWRSFDRSFRAIVLIAPLLLLLASTFVGWLVTLPFGFFAGLPSLIIFDASDQATYAVLVAVGAVLNSVGILGTFGFVARRLKLL